MLFFYSIVLIVLLLSFLLVRKIMVLYFNAKKRKYAFESNYLSRYAIFLLYLAFCTVNPSISESILNWLIIGFNKQFNTTLEPFELKANPSSAIIYIIFAGVVAYIIHRSYQKRFNDLNEQNVLRLNLSDEKKINYPENALVESPHFNLRIKRLLELKHGNDKLNLKISKSENVLYGKFIDGPRDRIVVVKYHDSVGPKDFDKNSLDGVLKELQNFANDHIASEPGKERIIDFYFCSQAIQ